jgi:MerR family mercuric resistance operon transcriptional regulator
MDAMTIGQLAAAAKVNVETVRYYQRRGLLTSPVRAPGTIGRYPDAALARLNFIRRSQGLGFSLEEVQVLLSLEEDQACGAARALGERKLAEVRQRIVALQALEEVLQGMVRECAKTKRARVSCPLIDALAGAADSDPSPRHGGGRSELLTNRPGPRGTTKALKTTRWTTQ